MRFGCSNGNSDDRLVSRLLKALPFVTVHLNVQGIELYIFSVRLDDMTWGNGVLIPVVFSMINDESKKEADKGDMHRLFSFLPFQFELDAWMICRKRCYEIEASLRSLKILAPSVTIFTERAVKCIKTLLWQPNKPQWLELSIDKFQDYYQLGHETKLGVDFKSIQDFNEIVPIHTSITQPCQSLSIIYQMNVNLEEIIILGLTCRHDLI